ncbi:MAG: anthranilate synthase component I family protein [Myxococcota bacterium]
MPKRAYLAAIDACQRQLRAGESYEICLTTALEAAGGFDTAASYSALRTNNPAPYAALLRFGDVDILSSSPERFLKIDRTGVIESKPIKGTTARGTTADEDETRREALRRDEKTRSENLMIVDLSRHDLGAVCELGSVSVPRLMAIESYATVHHMVSTIQGVLRAEVDAIEATRRCFPGGSMTGAPKLRTVEILRHLEGEPRGPYSGALGYFSCNGTADLSIVIRTAVIRPEGVAIGTGGAILAVSDPESELEEARLKGQVVVDALRRTATD